MEQLQTFVAHVDASLNENRPVVVHCLAGIGRTGTFLASYLVHCGARAEQAVVEVRAKRPESIENEEQEQAVHQFEGLLNL
jgi:atypical dual specificity phosphatase